MKFLFLLALVFALSIFAFERDAFGIAGCDVPYCYAIEQSTRSTPVDGIQFKLDSTDL